MDISTLKYENLSQQEIALYCLSMTAHYAAGVWSKRRALVKANLYDDVEWISTMMGYAEDTEWYRKRKMSLSGLKLMFRSRAIRCMFCLVDDIFLNLIADLEWHMELSKIQSGRSPIVHPGEVVEIGHRERALEAACDVMYACKDDLIESYFGNRRPDKPDITDSFYAPLIFMEDSDISGALWLRRELEEFCPRMKSAMADLISDCRRKLLLD